MTNFMDKVGDFTGGDGFSDIPLSKDCHYLIAWSLKERVVNY